MVEVLNATDRRGLARLGTRLLRERGVDVIHFGTADTTLDTTLVLVRRGDEDAGERVARALGIGRVGSRPDTLLRVDVSVLLGRDFSPPAGIRP